MEITEKLKKVGESCFGKKKNWENPCIYRVPPILLVGGNDHDHDHNFRPRFVSLGPYHYGDPRLDEMQSHKHRMLHCILTRTRKNLTQFLEAVRPLEDDARACYQDSPQITALSSRKFLEILVLDGCFVLDLLHIVSLEESYVDLGYIEQDPVFSKYYICSGILMDMILLENQIPLFILNCLYDIQFNGPHDNKVVDLMFRLFSSNMVTGRKQTSNNVPFITTLSASMLQNVGYNRPESCLEVLWHNLMFGSTTEKYTAKRVQHITLSMADPEENAIPNVTMMKAAGVKLKHRRTTPFWDIEFKSGVLEIPQILVAEPSEGILINLFAFELRHVHHTRYKIIPYVIFMDSLLNSASDVAELRNRKIIVGTGLTDHEILDMFNSIGRRPVMVPLAFEQMCRDIHKYCAERRRRWRATLMQNYFNTPWPIISLIAAAFMLLLTTLQTCFTVAQFYHN